MHGFAQRMRGAAQRRGEGAHSAIRAKAANARADDVCPGQTGEAADHVNRGAAGKVNDAHIEQPVGRP